MKNLYRWPLALLFLVVLTGPMMAQPQNLSLTSFATGFNDPLDVTHAGDERVFVVEKDGKIWIVDQQGNKNPFPFLDIDARVNSGASERGLLGLAFHPDYAQNGYFFVNYTNASGHTVISRFSVGGNPDTADPNSEVILLTINQPYSNHNGGCIKFGSDGYLYIGMGDGGSGGDPQGNGQKRSTLLGKMLRLDVDTAPYTIPADNPWAGNADTLPEIWAFGLRNPWRFSFDRITGDMWIGDVGQNAYEEIDFEAALDGGRNYGWRCYEANVAYNTAGCQAQGFYDAPIFDFNHNVGNSCSVTGGFRYRGARYGNLWGYYFHTDYCSGLFWYTWWNGASWSTQNVSSLGQYDFVSFGEDFYGELYVAGLGSGNVYRLTDNTCTPKAYINAPANVEICGNGMLEALLHPDLDYQWLESNAPIAGATQHTYSPTMAGNYSVIVSNGNCADTSDVVAVTIGNGPVVDIVGLDTLYCEDDTAIVLSGTPAGGNFSGPGVMQGSFDPAVAGPGTHQVVYTYQSTPTCVGADTLEVTVTVCLGTEPTLTDAIRLSPNPNDGHFSLDLPASPTPVSLRLMEATGRLVWSRQAGGNYTAMRLEVAENQLSAGIYFLEVRIGMDRKVIRVVIE